MLQAICYASKLFSQVVAGFLPEYSFMRVQMPNHNTLQSCLSYILQPARFECYNSNTVRALADAAG